MRQGVPGILTSLAVLLGACAPEAVPTPPVAPEAPVPTACERCLHEGEQLFETEAGPRRVLVFLPESTEGAPVLFVFHGFTVPPEPYLEQIPLDEAVEDGFVVVVPESRHLQFEWDLESPPELNDDVGLFDALLDTLVIEQGVDAERVYATGFSAGGLMTSYLTMHRAERLAATAPFSGGVFPIGAYATPRGEVDVLVHWGGDSDAIFGYNFNLATLQLRNGLVADGQRVYMCNHGLGHRWPADGVERTRTWLRTHASGAPQYLEGCVRAVP